MRELLSQISYIERIVNEDRFNDEEKYNIVFNTHKHKIAPLIEETGLKFDWYDPDATYIEDVMYYMRALNDFKEKLLILESLQ